jgi:prophage tail gpP-like protein
MPKLDQVVLDAGGYDLRNWNGYRVHSDILAPADQASLTISLAGGKTAESFDKRSEVREVLSPGEEISLSIVKPDGAKALQFTGVIDERDVQADSSSGMVITVSARNRAAHLVDSDVNLTVGRKDQRFVAMCEAAVAPWEIPVICHAEKARWTLTSKKPKKKEISEDELDATTAFGAVFEPAVAALAGFDTETMKAANLIARQRVSQGKLVRGDRGATATATSAAIEAAAALAGGSFPALTEAVRLASGSASRLSPGDIKRLVVKDMKPQAGEKVWEYLDRHAKKLGIMMWMSPEGALILSSPQYNQKPLFRIVRRFRSRSEDPNNVKSGVRMTSTADRYSECAVYGRTHGDDALRARITHNEKDLDCSVYRPMTIHDQSIRTLEDAKRRARRELALGRQRADVLTYEVAGHSQNGVIWAVDTICSVVDEVAGIAGDYYITGREFSKDVGAGTRTNLTLMPKGAIVLGDA